MKTLVLDDTWDLAIENGSFVVSDGSSFHKSSDVRKSLPYGIAQKVANKIRLFTNDAYFDLSRGISHFSYEFSQNPTIDLLTKKIQEEASKVENVSSAKVEFLEVKNRVLSGRILLELENGEKIYVEI